ncbi:hypothetical protein BD410DRAFT_847215 [Rickenella mellea]|uniref:Uncharacterized protein n=1 Tax=Rickenella mellea TaxID=50990 RepID=A0A4R5XF91_9AGAM|nr:hypothetical protein BD410DRAFT_847215 [Rickenella mellea]
MPSNTSAPLVDTPLPTDLDPTFLACLNSTIRDSVPLADLSHRFNAAEIFGITLASGVAGLLLAAVLICIILFCWCCCAACSEIKEHNKMWNMKTEGSKKRKSAAKRNVEYRRV